jgi:hypothetical protein
MKLPSWTRRAIVACTVVVMGSCGGSGGSGDAPPASFQQTVNAAAGGRITADARDSRIFGLQITVRPNSLQGESEVVSIESQDDLPGPLSPEMIRAGFQPLLPTLVLRRSGTKDFNDPVLLRLPFSPQALADRDVIATVWEPETSSYQPLEIVAVDRQAGFVYALTRHFSLFNLFSYSVPEPPTVPAQFLPSVHGFEHPNISTTKFGDYGDCYGIASFSTWHWRRYRGQSLDRQLYNRFGNGDGSFAGDNLVREIMAEAQASGLNAGGSRIHTLLMSAYPDGAELLAAGYSEPGAPRLTQTEVEVFQARRLAVQLSTFGPQLLVFRIGATGTHAVVVYEYRANALTSGGTFFAYDPNLPHPAAPLAIGWSAGEGFIPFTHPGYGFIDQFWVTGSDTWFSHQALASVEQRAINGLLTHFSGGVSTLNALSPDGQSRFCLTTPTSGGICHIVTPPLPNLPVAGDPVRRPQTYVVAGWNRTRGVQAIDNALLGDDETKTEHIPVRAGALQPGTVETVELFAHTNSGNSGAGVSPEFIERRGYGITDYRAFTSIPLQIGELQLRARAAPDGFEVYATVDGRQVLPAAGDYYEWSFNGSVLPSARSSTLKLTGAVLPSGQVLPVGKVSLQFKEGSRLELNPTVEADFGNDYDATFTVRSAEVPPTIERECAGAGSRCSLFCGFGQTYTIGETFQAQDRWTPTLSGTVRYQSVSDITYAADGTFATRTGALSVQTVDPRVEVTPPGSQARYFSSGETSITATLSAVDGTIRGTYTDTVRTTWDVDGSVAECRFVADYVATPVLPILPPVR